MVNWNPKSDVTTSERNGAEIGSMLDFQLSVLIRFG